MKWLLWKDVCLNRSLLGVVVVLLLLPYVVLCGLGWSSDHPLRPIFAPGFLVGSAIWSLMWLQLPLAFMAGQALAGERMDRSAEFLGLLPVSRGQIAASKLLILLGVLALIWIPNLVVLAGAVPRLTGTSTLAHQFLPWVRTIPLVGMALGGGAWLCSSKMDNPVFASCLGMLLVMAALVGSASLLNLLGYSPQTGFGWGRAVCMVLAATCFIVGTVVYLRRAEP